jgi:hypothetical protein
MTKTILLAHIAATLFLAGVAWVVQIVQYPFFSEVSPEKFSAFHRTYTTWVTPVVAPPMIVELATAIALLYFKPENIDVRLIWCGLIMVALLWASTFFLQVPLHDKLSAGFSAENHAALVGGNWIRTVLWSLRGVLVLYFLWLNLK